MSCGESIGPGNLKHYKTLSVDDKAFEFATILTPGNRERHEFNNIQVRRWAKRNKTNVVRWPRKIQNWKGKPSNPLNVFRAKEQESCFWELFVPEALAYLTFNLNVDKGLANGVEVKYDSISFQKKEDQIKFESQLAEAHPGEVISLTVPPDFINVELFPDFSDDDEKTRKKNETKRKQWKHGSMTDDGRIVIPIDIHNKQKVQWKTCKIRGGGASNFTHQQLNLQIISLLNLASV
jgi:hypothetical protein